LRKTHKASQAKKLQYIYLSKKTLTSVIFTGMMNPVLKGIEKKFKVKFLFYERSEMYGL